MKILKFYPLMLVCIFLSPLSRWLERQHDPHFFLGLGSDFWAGVTLGVSIVCGLAFIAVVVVYVLAARTGSPGEKGQVE